MPQHPIHAQRISSTGSVETLSDDDLEDLSVDDLLFCPGHAVEVHLRLGPCGHLGFGRMDVDDIGRTRCSETVDHGSDAGDAGSVCFVDAGVCAVDVEHIGHEGDHSRVVVVHGDVAGDHQLHSGQVVFVGTGRSEPFEASDDVPAEVSDEAGDHGRQFGFAGLDGEQIERGDDRVEDVSVGGDADRRGAGPVESRSGGAQRGDGSRADEGVAGPGSGDSGFEQEAAGSAVGELAVEAQRGLGVREHPSVHGYEPMVGTERTELFEAGADRQVGRFRT